VLGPTAVGTVAWNESLTTGPEGAHPFYQAVFGWSYDIMDLGSAGPYHVFKRAGAGVAGMLQVPPGAISRPQWVPYFAVADVNATFARALSLGAEPHVQPQDVSGVGRFATVGDQTGASFGLFAAGTA